MPFPGDGIVPGAANSVWPLAAQIGRTAAASTS